MLSQVMSSKLIAGTIASLVVLGLASCQTTSTGVSIDEARRITTEFGGRSFTPPPRTVSDVTAILSKQAQDDLEGVEEARKLANSLPSVTASVGQLATFYNERAKAARTLGRSGQEIADFRLAFENAREYRDADLMDETGYLLALAQVFTGSFSQAVTDWEQAVQVSKGYAWGALDLAEAYAVLADIYAKAGDPEGVKLAASNSLAASRRAVSSYPDPADRYIKSAMRAWREASLLEISGHYAEAEPLLHKAIKGEAKVAKMESFGGYDEIITNLLRANLADNLRKQGRLVEAEVVAREALTTALKMNGRYSAQTGYMLGSLTRVVFEQGRFTDAEVLARANIKAYGQSGVSADSLYYVRARIDLADALGAQGRWQEALAQYEQARDALASDAYATKKFIAGNVNWAITLLESGRGEEALDVLRNAEVRLEPIYGQGHYALAEVHGFTAKALAVSGQQAAALDMFKAAAPILLEGARKNDSEGGDATTRARKLRSILESYIGLLADIRGTGLERQAGVDAAVESFHIAGAARMHSVQRALSASGARAAVRDPDLADLVRREQDAKQQTDALLILLTDMLAQPTAQRSAAAVAATRADIDRLQAARTAILEQIETGFPDYAELIAPKPTTDAQAQASLSPDEALITTYVGADKTYVWAIPSSGEVTFAAVDLGRDALAKIIEDLRSALDPQNVSILGDIPDFNVTKAYSLYKKLLEPVTAGWKDAKNILVVADGPLGRLPFSLLPTEPASLAPEKSFLFANYRNVPWLTRTHAVTVLPSVASLHALRRASITPTVRRPFVGFGDPYFNAGQALAADEDAMVQMASTGDGTRSMPITLRVTPQTRKMDSAALGLLPRLPDTRPEITSIANVLGADMTQDVYLGRDASEHNVKTQDLSVYKVLSFATHGLIPGDLNGLTQPALALSSPDVTGDKDNDGFLTMGEVLGLKLNADWVVLSACNTAAGEGRGAEAVSGLGRAFFYAGSRALLVSNWPVHSAATTELMTTLFSKQANNNTLTRAEALRQTRTQLIDEEVFKTSDGKAAFSYAHPIFWAPFSLIGDGGS